MKLEFTDPSLLKGATAQSLLSNQSEIFASNVLSAKEVPPPDPPERMMQRIVPMGADGGAIAC